jgi:hypothetical protein
LVAAFGDYRYRESEVYELGQHLSTWPDNVETETVSLLRGQNFALQKHLISKGNPTHVQFHHSSDKSVRWQLKANDISGLVDIPGGSRIFNGGIIATVLFGSSYDAPKGHNNCSKWIYQRSPYIR